MGRTIGIFHGVKTTTKGESRPTRVTVMQGDGDVHTYELADDQAELDWLLGVYPTSYKVVPADTSVQGIPAHHVIRKKDAETMKIPASTDGLWSGDRVLLMMNGFANRLAYAISRRGSLLGATVFRIGTHEFSRYREAREAKDDSVLLATLMSEYDQTPDGEASVLHEVLPADAHVIRLIEEYRSHGDVQRDRIACEQRLFEQVRGEIFCNPHGHYPEGDIELAFDRAKASDVVLKSLLKVERARKKKVEATLVDIPVYQNVLSTVTGVGPLISARIIASVGSIKRFPTEAKFAAYCGVHLVKQEGERDKSVFPRRTKGQRSNWSGMARQAFFLLVEQALKRPESQWGMYLRRMKEAYATRHPDKTKMQVHRAAMWRTATRFNRWLYREWRKLEFPAKPEVKSKAV